MQAQHVFKPFLMSWHFVSLFMMYNTDFITLNHMPTLWACSKHVPKHIVGVWEVDTQTAFETFYHHVPSAGPHAADVVCTLH